VAALRAAGCVFAEDEAALLLDAATGPDDLAFRLSRRVAGIPLEYVLGWAAFAGLRIAVDEAVFVPRHRTELLVDLATELALTRLGEAGHLVVVDLCCGTGALGAALASRLPGPATVPVPRLDPGGDPGARAALTGALELHVADIDPVAVRCAARNVAPLGGQAHVGDLYAALPAALRGRVDVLLANAPYVPTGAIALMPPEARDHEPPVALDGGADGLDVLRRVLAGAGEWLAPGGHVLVEAGEDQIDALLAAVAVEGLSGRVVHDDEGEATAVVAARPPA
jgi:release factor glutamine methyltransferase